MLDAKDLPPQPVSLISLSLSTNPIQFLTPTPLTIARRHRSAAPNQWVSSSNSFSLYKSDPFFNAGWPQPSPDATYPVPLHPDPPPPTRESHLSLSLQLRSSFRQQMTLLLHLTPTLGPPSPSLLILYRYPNSPLPFPLLLFRWHTLELGLPRHLYLYLPRVSSPVESSLNGTDFFITSFVKIKFIMRLLKCNLQWDYMHCTWLNLSNV